MTKHIKLSGPIPGPKSAQLMARRAKAVMGGVSTLHPIFVDHAHGATVTDVDGNTYIDFAGGIGVMNVGHTHDEVVTAIRAQAGRCTHACFQVAGYEEYVAVAEALCRLSPGDFEKRALLVSTGAEAVENAVKIARGATKRSGVLCFEHAFHGRTLLAVTLTGKALPYKAGFGPYAGEVYRLPFPYAYRGEGQRLLEPGGIEGALRTIVRPQDLAAVIFEPVLGEGGFLVPPPAFVSEVRAFCDRHGIVLIADEVQSGMGRTGTMFACEQLGLVPDLVTVAKSIAGGLPLSAVVGRASVMDPIAPGGTGGTFAGNPVSCAAALTTIALLEKELATGRPRALGQRVRERMLRWREAAPIVGDVRGLGAMLAMELVRDRETKEPADAETKALVQRARERGVLLIAAGTHGNVIRFLFPITITDSELDEGLNVIGELLGAL